MRTVNHVLTKMLYVTPKRGLLYVTDISYNGQPSHRMGHLACYFPGLLALGVHTLHPKVFAASPATFTSSQKARLSSYNMTDLHLWAAIGLGETCWHIYADQATGLGVEAVAMHHSEGGSVGTESGLWIDALDKWRATGASTIPPGVEEKIPTTESDKRDYDLIRNDYLLRPEASQSVI